MKILHKLITLFVLGHIIYYKTKKGEITMTIIKIAKGAATLTIITLKVITGTL